VESVGNYEYFREDEKGELVLAYRTAIVPGEKPTTKQVVGQAAFAKKRFNPHHSKIKLLLIERTRIVFQQLRFDINETDKKIFQKNLQRARVVAARQLRREREKCDRAARRRQDYSRRMNKGLL
jgi:hypothetical protein